MTAAEQPVESGGDLRSAVAEEVRAWLGRRRVSGAGLARALGKSQTWVARRLDGRQAFDVDDLELIAAELQVPVTAFFANSLAQRSSNQRYQGKSTNVVTLFPQLKGCAGPTEGVRLGQMSEHSRAS